MQLKHQGSSRAAVEFGYNQQGQTHSPSLYPYQAPQQSPPSTSPFLTVENKGISLLERELRLQNNLDLLIARKSTIRDSDSRELYMAVLQDEIDIRKELQEVIEAKPRKRKAQFQVIKENYGLEEEEAFWRKREDTTRSTGFEFVQQQNGAGHKYQAAPFGPGSLRMNDDITLAHNEHGQCRYDEGQRWEVSQTKTSLTELYDSDSGEKFLQVQTIVSK